MLPELMSPHLLLRPATAVDLGTLWEIWIEPEVRRFLFDDEAIPRDRAAELLAECQGLAEDGLGLWAICPREAAAVIGCVGLFPVTVAAEFEPRLAGGVEPLIALAPAVWHLGHATEALATVIAYAFETRGLAQLVAAVDVPNAASHRMVERLGFEVLGECDGPRYRLRTYRLIPAAFMARTSHGFGARA